MPPNTKKYIQGLVTGIALSIVSTIIVGYMVIGQLMAATTVKVDNNSEDIKTLEQEMKSKAPLQMLVGFIEEYRADMRELKGEKPLMKWQTKKQR